MERIGEVTLEEAGDSELEFRLKNDLKADI